MKQARSIDLVCGHHDDNAGAQGIVIDHRAGWIMGGADPRRNGYAEDC